MKTKALTAVIFLLVIFQAEAQNRITAWNPDQISEIRIRKNASDSIATPVNIRKKEEIRLILSFLGTVELNNITERNFRMDSLVTVSKYRFEFTGQRDQVTLCEDFMIVGKTVFSVSKDVAAKFTDLLAGLMKN